MKIPAEVTDNDNDPPVRVLNFSKGKQELSYARTRNELIERSNFGQLKVNMIKSV